MHDSMANIVNAITGIAPSSSATSSAGPTNHRSPSPSPPASLSTNASAAATPPHGMDAPRGASGPSPGPGLQPPHSQQQQQRGRSPAPPGHHPPSPPPMSRNAAASASSDAETHKQQGNNHFLAGRYEDAVREYSVAIIKNPTNPVYYTNRALTFLRLRQFERCISDCEKAIEIDARNVKGHYLLGQALVELGPSRLNEAIAALKKAYSVAIEQKIGYADEIASAIRKGRARRWELEDRKRREEESDLYRYLVGLVERDRRRQLEQLVDPSDEDRSQVQELQDQRVAQITDLFGRAEQNGKKREIPDVFLGKISFELMTDPVITPSGIT
ncbi:hypothetical protein HK405_014445, partial [Cladochytrium tenue]